MFSLGLCDNFVRFFCAIRRVVEYILSFSEDSEYILAIISVDL